MIWERKVAEECSRPRKEHPGEQEAGQCGSGVAGTERAAEEDLRAHLSPEMRQTVLALGIRSSGEHFHLGQRHWTIIGCRSPRSNAHACSALFHWRFREESRAGGGGWGVNGLE